MKNENAKYRDNDSENGGFKCEYTDLPAYEESSSNMALNASFFFFADVLPLCSCFLRFF